MNRRQVLAQIGSGTVVTLAGCISGAESSGTPDSQPSPDQESPSPTTNDSSPSDPAVSDYACPPYDSDRDRAVCSHTVATDSEPVYLEPTPVQTTLDDRTPSEEITLTLHNQSATDLTFNPHSWRIWHTDDANWTELDQQRSGNGTLTVSSNETHSWSFTQAVESIRDDPAFETGVYAAEIGVPDPNQSNEWVACIALVKLGSN